jgi:hypothetical protein
MIASVTRYAGTVHHLTPANVDHRGQRVIPPFWSVKRIPRVMTAEATSFAACFRRNPCDS